MIRSYLRKSYEITGYTFNADTYCTNCVSEDEIDSENNPANPIFLGSEWEHKIYCSNCNEEIDVSVIESEN